MWIQKNKSSLYIIIDDSVKQQRMNINQFQIPSLMRGGR